MLRVRLEKEVERVVDGHLRDQVDFDAQLVDFLGERQPGDVVALRILLPVEEVLGGVTRWEYDRIGVRQCGAGRRRTSCGESSTGRSYAVWRDVSKRDVNAHGLCHLVGCDISVCRRYEDLPLRPLRTPAVSSRTRECVSCGHRSPTCRTCRLVGSLEPAGADALAVARWQLRRQSAIASATTTRIERSATGRCRRRRRPAVRVVPADAGHSRISRAGQPRRAGTGSKSPSGAWSSR